MKIRNIDTLIFEVEDECYEILEEFIISLESLSYFDSEINIISIKRITSNVKNASLLQIKFLLRMANISALVSTVMELLRKW